ncbi:hypothetical protein BU24DRAFT_66131 [Aaosphaeria arxii CBS 175.79]|uniref:Uncharacterized protein n=1 Tax=Aaosphaeria arxii CBS 175.79 TaxID=1450172 RepID=A0A6A5XAQ7_9PLEO|nr:uncharacterized protein BU24DRAFT_66131 [Aaosphaeria arxii CBS 175.79]KAF2009854.1 hypothetical protein BU24DRAFT_66131 [Aaosphaeria arxii CBS 175.79]
MCRSSAPQSLEMDHHDIVDIDSNIELVNAMLDADPQSWRDHLRIIRTIIATTDMSSITPNQGRKASQIQMIRVCQRVAYADADNGGMLDIGNWCLRQALSLLSLYPNEVGVLELIGRNWLLRAQKSLAKIQLTDPESSSSGASLCYSTSPGDRNRQVAEAEERLYTADYVEARGILLPATEYLQRAVDNARAQDVLTGSLLGDVSLCLFCLRQH